MSTDPTASAEFVILRYCRRWSVDQAFLDSKQFLGLHDPRVCCLQSVERAYPMARFLGTRTILWHSLKGHEGSHAIKDRPWYDKKVTPTFADMLGRCGCRCGSRRFMESSPSDHPHRNPSNSCCAGSPPLRESPKL